MEFKPFPKMARLSREIVVSEKLDGTNACIGISNTGELFTGSRTRWITPDDDNYGFSRWAHEHKQELLRLGPGVHFGEYWGRGIQRGYDLKEKRFSLFNTLRWALHGTEPQIKSSQDPRVVKTQDMLPECCGLVPVLYRGSFDTIIIQDVLNDLEKTGSKAAPGFMHPEGIVVYHVAAGIGFKKALKNDGLPKTLVR